MKLKPRNKSPLILATFFVIMSACSSKPEVKKFPDSANAKEEVTKLESSVEQTKNQDYNLLAPESMKEARKYSKEARSMEKKDKSDKKILDEVATGQAYLDQAKKVSDENRMKLQDVIVARDAAIEAKANTVLPEEFAKMDKKVAEETAKLEKGKKDDLKDKRSGLITGYQALEVGAIKKTNIGESKFLIDKSIKAGAQELTPKTLATANKDYQTADQFITKNRHDSEGIAVVAAAALVSARNLDATLATAKGIKSTSPEETALKMKAEDERLTQTEGQLADAKGEQAALLASNEDFERQQQLNANYEEARKKFKPEEAEVYKQGDKLVIRLRSLNFPVDQAVLKGDDFALLKKVGDVIDSFDKSAVIVEGHTDSTGGKALNQKLSDERANAVKEYLKTNVSGEVSEIEARGFGYDKPLASNKTSQGRAENRRVDILIEPTKI